MNDIVDTRIQRILDIDDAKICNLHHQIYTCTQQKWQSITILHGC